MNRVRTGRIDLGELERRVSARDRKVVGDVAELRLLSARQIEALHFPAASFSSPLSAARCARRVLERLSQDRLLIRLNRRIGGLRAGSSGYVYSLGPVGQRLLALDGPRRRLREPSEPFVTHTLAIAQLVIDLTLADRLGALRVIKRQAEPDCWRALPGHRRATLRPDLYVVLEADEVELRWFIEVDRGTAHIPAVLRKSQLYENYYRSGVEQVDHGVFPRVLWITPTSSRADRLSSAIAADRRLTRELFAVTTTEGSLEALRGMGSEQ